MLSSLFIVLVDCSFAMYIEKCYYGGEENFSGKNKSQVEKPLMVQDMDYVVDSDEGMWAWFWAWQLLYMGWFIL